MIAVEHEDGGSSPRRESCQILIQRSTSFFASSWTAVLASDSVVTEDTGFAQDTRPVLPSAEPAPDPRSRYRAASRGGEAPPLVAQRIRDLRPSAPRLRTAPTP